MGPKKQQTTTTTCLTSTGPAEPQRARIGSQRRVDGVPAGRRLAGRGVRVRAFRVRLTLVLKHPERRHGELLPVGTVGRTILINGVPGIS